MKVPKKRSSNVLSGLSRIENGAYYTEILFMKYDFLEVN